MHIVYFGIVSRLEDIGKIGETSIAGNKMQYNLLKNLSQKEDVSIDVVSFHPYKPFRKSKKLFVKATKEKLFDNVDMYQVGYVNIPLIKQLIISRNTKKTAKKLLNGQQDVLMIFDMYPTQSNAFTKLSKKVKGRAVCLLADLSIGGVVKTKGIKKLLRKMYDKQTLANLSKCNYFIALNENAMKTYAPHSKYLIVDGGIEPSEYQDINRCWAGKIKNVVYTGALVDYSGIKNLISAIDLLNNKEIVLDIYGDGILKEEIIEIAKNNKRIRYLGKVSNQECVEIQQSAWLLANPRPTENDIAKVTFPSKIFEYLMSGRPVMSTRLNGFSKDYENLLFWTDDCSVEGLAEKINQIDKLDNEHLTLMATEARQYLLKNKTWDINANNINEFLKRSFK